jgi:predicted nucleic acid-binding protein
MGGLTSRDQVQAQVRLDQLRGGWREVPPSDALRERAEEHVERFVLRAADSLQLAAAWIWCQGHPRNRRFISGDAHLIEAARKLGFTAIEL